MAVPRFLPTFTPPGNDPYQREIFIRHSVGSGRYAEIFTTYYAHMQDTGVRRGDVVSAGTRLGQAGETGAASGEHLHLGVFRNRNLSWRQSFEFNFVGGRWADRCRPTDIGFLMTNLCNAKCVHCDIWRGEEATR